MQVHIFPVHLSLHFGNIISDASAASGEESCLASLPRIGVASWPDVVVMRRRHAA